MAKKIYLNGEEFPFTAVKGNAETSYRTGDVNLTPANIGASPLGHSHGNSDITSLDASKITSGTIDITRLPQGALERLTIVADDTARFKLTSSTIQKGDTVKVTSTGKMYYVVDESKLSTEAGYEVYAAGTAASVPWSGVTGKPNTYTPSSHTHDDRYYTESEINSKLSGKANSSHTHTKSQITDFPTSMPASDVPAWAKASTKPSYSKSEVGLGNVDNTADSAKSVKYATSAGSATTATNATKVNNHTVNSDVPANAKFTDTNTWRGIQNNLTSTATDQSLSAAQGKALANGSARDNTKLPLAGGTMTGALNLANNTMNKVGDDVSIGDHNVGGSLGVKAQSSTPKITFINTSGSTMCNIGSSTANVLETSATSFKFGDCTLQYDSTNKCVNFVFA